MSKIWEYRVTFVLNDWFYVFLISVWADADTWFERQQQEEEMRRIETENRAAMQAAEDIRRKQLAQEREGEKEEEIDMKDDPMAKAEAEALNENGS